MSGWIKLHRSLRDHFLFDFNEPDKALAWIDLLMSASFEDSKIKIKGRVIDVKRGQFCVSQVTLQKRWGMSQNKVKRFLLMLKNEGMIGLETNELASVITICNYDSFQSDERADERADERSDERGTNEQTNDIKRIKEDKELKNKKDISPVQPQNDKPDEVAEVFTHWQQVMSHPRAKLDAKRTKLIRSAIKMGYTTEDLKNAITGYTKSPWHMGQNPEGTRYDSLETLIRDAKQIDAGLKHLENNAGVKPYGNQTHHSASNAGRYENPTARLLRMAREYEPAADTGNIIEADFKAH